MKSPYITAAGGMYLNFFILGMVNIIFASNMSSLTEQLNTTTSGISLLLSAFGIGKLLTYALNGYLSDKLGRKPLVAFSSILMAIFLIGFPMAPNYQIAFVLAVLMGIANSAMDSGTYPALTESFPKSAGTANVLAKASNSVGAILLPILITFLATNNI
ncbi:MFS transporter, partial [Terribacillus saccharophilus]